MKGRLLSYSDIIKLPHGAAVWLSDNLGEGLAHVNQDEKFISDVDSNIGVCAYDFDELSNDPFIKAYRINIYEWLEDSESEQTITKTEKETNTYNKTYKGSEILAMIEDGILKDDDVIIDKETDEYIIRDIRIGGVEVGYLFSFAPFTIKQNSVDFMTAVNSGKLFKVEHKFIPESYGYIGLDELFSIVTYLGINSTDIYDIIKNGKYYLSD